MGVCCPETLTYTRHLLRAIGTPNQPPVDVAAEEAISGMLKVLLADEHNLSDEAQERAKNIRRTWRVMREMFERHELRALLRSESRKFIREQEDGR